IQASRYPGNACWPSHETTKKANAMTGRSTSPCCGYAGRSKTTPSNRAGSRRYGAWAIDFRREGRFRVELACAAAPLSQDPYAAAHIGHHRTGPGRHLRHRKLLSQAVHGRRVSGTDGDHHTHVARRSGRDPGGPAAGLRAYRLAEPVAALVALLA